MTISEQEYRSEKLCWSVFASASSSVSIAGLLLYIAGINFGAILLSFGIQVLVISFLFYCWTRCWRRLKPDEKTSDPPPSYKNEWRIDFFTPRTFTDSSAQASRGLSEHFEPVTIMKLPDNKRQDLASPVEASASSIPVTDIHVQNTDDHAVTLEHIDTEISTRQQTSSVETRTLPPGYVHRQFEPVLHGAHYRQSNSEGTLSSSWRSENRLSEPPRLSGLELFYKNHPEAHYMPVTNSNNLGLPSYDEAIEWSQADGICSKPPKYSES